MNLDYDIIKKIYSYTNNFSIAFMCKETLNMVENKEFYNTFKTINLFKNLKFVIFYNCNFKHDDFVKLQNIKKIKFTNCIIDIDDIIDIDYLNLNNITNISFFNMYINYNLMIFISKMKSLKSLNLKYSSFDEDDLLILNNNSKSNITHLDISNTNVTNEIFDIIQNFKCLKCLNVSNCANIIFDYNIDTILEHDSIEIIFLFNSHKLIKNIIKFLLDLIKVNDNYKLSSFNKNNIKNTLLLNNSNNKIIKFLF